MNEENVKHNVENEVTIPLTQELDGVYLLDTQHMGYQGHRRRVPRAGAGRQFRV